MDPALVAQIDGIVAQVPSIRGLAAKKSVPYRFITQDQFAALFQAQFDRGNPPAQLAAETALDIRLGLLPPGTDLRVLVERLYASQVAAFYDPDTGAFTVVRRTSGSAFSAWDRSTVAHEYDHALQDQSFNLRQHQVRDPSQGDRAAAELALTEGDAVALQLQWAIANLTPQEFLSLGNAVSPQDQEILNSSPLLLRRTLEFPYVSGLQFVSALFSQPAGGWSAVNSAWANPPQSTEQIMHPEKYLTGEQPVVVTLPDLATRLGAGWKAGAAQTAGELVTGIWLAHGQDSPMGAPLPNAAAAAGWGGDRVVSLDGPNGSWAVVWQTSWDTPQDAQEFVAAANSVMADLPGQHRVTEQGIAAGLAAPVLVLIASDVSALNALEAAVGR